MSFEKESEEAWINNLEGYLNEMQREDDGDFMNVFMKVPVLKRIMSHECLKQILEYRIDETIRLIYDNSSKEIMTLNEISCAIYNLLKIKIKPSRILDNTNKFQEETGEAVLVEVPNSNPIGYRLADNQKPQYLFR